MDRNESQRWGGRTLQVEVKLFAGMAQRAKTRSVILDLAEGAKVADLVAELGRVRPELAEMLGSVRVAVNQTFVDGDAALPAGAEVALIPPVSGGSEPLFEITEAPLSADKIAALVTNPHSGATTVFCGTVREYTRGKRTVRLEYEAYREMAIKMMEQIGAEIAAKWPESRTAIWHRIGRLEIGESSVVIAVATPHRADAFEACRHAIERLKQIVPIWKKEVWDDGEMWVGSQTGPWY